MQDLLFILHSLSWLLVTLHSQGTHAVHISGASMPTVLTRAVSNITFNVSSGVMSVRTHGLQRSQQARGRWVDVDLQNRLQQHKGAFGDIRANKQAGPSHRHSTACALGPLNNRHVGGWEAQLHA